MRNKIAKQLRKLAAEDAVHADLRPKRSKYIWGPPMETPAEVLQRVTKSLTRRAKNKYKKLNHIQRAAFNHS